MDMPGHQTHPRTLQMRASILHTPTSAHLLSFNIGTPPAIDIKHPEMSKMHSISLSKNKAFSTLASSTISWMQATSPHFVM
jgi:hypothetical protein